MKIKDLYRLDDSLEHFVIHSAEEELASVEILNVEIEKENSKIVFNFHCDCNDKERTSGRQDDLSKKLQARVDKFHKNFITGVKINVYQK